MKYHQRLEQLLGKDIRVHVNMESYLTGTLLEVGEDYLLIRSNVKGNKIKERLVQFDTIWWLDSEVAELSSKLTKDSVVDMFNKMFNP